MRFYFIYCAIGQIPFAINQMRAELRFGKTMQSAISNTIAFGRIFGGGLFGQPDRTRSYDNFMVLRGALFGSQRFESTRIPTYEYIEHGIKIKSFDVIFSTKKIDSNKLENPISKQAARNYGY